LNPSLKIVFAGTPDFAARHLQALIDSSYDIVAVYTQPDRPAGRGKKLQASAVKQLAENHHLPVYQPESLKTEEARQQLAILQADVMVVVAYGQILPQAILDTPRFGCLNVHGSLLPRWRGAAPIQRAIWAGDKQTGVTIMQMDKGLDTGDMLYKASLDIQPDDTSATLYEKLAEIGPSALLYTLNHLHELNRQPQDPAAVTYASKLSKEEAKIDWTLPAEQLARHIRAFNPWPVCFFEINNQTVKVWQADVVAAQGEPGMIVDTDKSGMVVATGQDGLKITVMQMPGKKAMAAADILNARKDQFSVGSRLQ